MRHAAEAAPRGTIAFQGMPGAYSDLACRTVRPDLASLPCVSFEDAFAAVAEGRADLGMIPIDNSVAGRVADVHHLMPASGLHIVGEHFQRVEHQLLGPKGATLDGVKTVRSHIHALSQCRATLRKLGLTPVVAVDTAGAAKDVAESGDKTVAAIASRLAGEIYGLETLVENMEDAEHNTTRFLIMSRDPGVPRNDGRKFITSFVFRVRSVPAALYKALGGFATNGINLTKLESYMVGGSFEAAQFYVDSEGHPDERGMQHALDELKFFSRRGTFKILGVYPAHPFRMQNQPSDD